jgi:hypothetical protein
MARLRIGDHDRNIRHRLRGGILCLRRLCLRRGRRRLLGGRL